jgi:formate-dependent nitrite reductase membrane component NrfD
VLGPLFLLSGLSSAAALLAVLEPSAQARHRLSSLDLCFIAAETAALVLMFIGLASGGAAQRAAAYLFFGGAYTALFWIGIVFTGLLLPAVIEYLHRTGQAQATVYPAVLVLLGGFALRVIILFAGQASRWEYL